MNINSFFSLSSFKECEQELNRLKNLLDEMKTGEVTRSLADELTEVRDISFIIIISRSIHLYRLQNV
jgi:hypothetical protein